MARRERRRAARFPPAYHSASGARGEIACAWPGWAILEQVRASCTEMRRVGAVVGGQLALAQPLVDLGALGEDLGGLRLAFDRIVERVERLALASQRREREADHQIAA